MTLPQSVAAGGNSAAPYAAASNISNLSNVTITNANLTASEIPALNYLSLGGGTLTGSLSVPSISASSTNYGVITSTNSSTTNLSVFNTAWFGGTSTSTFTSTGALGIGTTTPWSDIGNASSLLDLTTNGTVRLTLHDTASTQEEKLSSDGTGFYIDSAGAALGTNNDIVFRVTNTNSSYRTFEAGRFTAAGLFGVGTTSPWAQLSASSTSATPTLAIQQNSTGPAAVFLGGNVGIGTTSPIDQFDVAGKSSGSVVATTAAVGDGTVVVRGTYAYGVNSSNGTLSITDISNPASPVIVSTTTVPSDSGGCEMGISVLGRYAYIVSDCSSNFTIYDISNPKSPVFISNTPGNNYPVSLAVQGKYAYVARSPFEVYDVSDPLNPQVVFNDNNNTGSFDSAYDVNSLVLSGRYLYATVVAHPVGGATASALAVQTIDVSGPGENNPRIVNTTTIGNWYGYSSTFDQTAIQGRYLYTISNDPNELFVVDISNPSSSSLVGSIALAGIPNALKVQGRYAYVAQSNGVGVYDISNASSPSYLGLLTSTNTLDLGISGRYAVTSAGEVLDLGGAYVQTLEAGDLLVGTLNVTQSSTFLNGLDALGGLNVGAPGFYSSGPVGITTEGGATNVLSVTAATTTQSTGKTTSFAAAAITNNATSSTASIIKSGLNIISQGSWTGTAASNIGLYVSSVSGGTNNYDAIFNGGNNVGIGTASPYSRLQITGPNSAATTSAFAVVNSASTTVFSVFDNGNSTYSGSIFQSSDQRLKTDVQSLDASSSLSAIELLNPVSYLRLDQPGTGENLGFIAQQVQQVFPQLVSTTSATALTPDGTLTLNYEGLISPIVSAIQALYADVQNLEQTVAGFAQSITSEQGTFTNELCVGSTCVTPAQFQALVAAANVSQSSGQGSGAQSSEDSQSTAPVIQINGDNPAIVQVGASYSDLGATITGPQQDLNLGISTFVNGVAMSPVQIDTSAIATDTIDYVATDQNGLTSTSTRTVIIEATANDNTPPSAATTTSSTSTPS